MAVGPIVKSMKKATYEPDRVRDPFDQRPVDLNPEDFFEFYDLTRYAITRCSHCGGLMFWADEKPVYPSGSGIKPVKCMPDNVREVFCEAQAITTLSPRAAWALLRVCLERLVVSLGAKGENLELKVQSLGLSKRLQMLCDACRLAGNEAVHKEGFDFSQSYEESLAMTFALSNFINHLADEFIGLEIRTEEIIRRLKEARAKKK